MHLSCFVEYWQKLFFANKAFVYTDTALSMHMYAVVILPVTIVNTGHYIAREAGQAN